MLEMLVINVQGNNGFIVKDGSIGQTQIITIDGF